jgi:2-keto-4-pentenoate hydratase/2-oxohepta-3-ene-1,7-dioic acid hydratase in catechol pathway|tara:strand:- start:2411 stop:3280 length:870 start_codon:yes stop_codon:yes gene_type:complete
MKLATFTHPSHGGIGVVSDDRILPLAAADLPDDMLQFLQLGDTGMSRAKQALQASQAGLPLAEVQLQAPVLRPGKFLAIALNYADHIEESGLDRPAHQTWFNKQITCVNGPDQPIHLPVASTMLDYEGELGVVIGKRCRHVPKDRALEVIAGFTIVNDVSVRDWQLRAQTFQIGKSFDTHGPCGPYLVTADEVADPHNLSLKTWVNDELRQDSNTRHLIFDCFEQIEHLSTAFTLEPGDVLATGTPAGVGMSMRPPQYLQEGDVIRIEIEKLGVLENRVAKEPGGTLIE